MRHEFAFASHWFFEYPVECGGFADASESNKNDGFAVGSVDAAISEF